MVDIFLKLVYSKHVKKKKKKTLGRESYYKAMYEFIKKGRKHTWSIICQLDLLDKLVKHIVSYGCEVWGFGNNGIFRTFIIDIL